jgi:predicted metal-dependent hydrolase
MMLQKYKDINYNLKKSNRKTISIYVERNGEITIIVPEQISQSKLDSIIESKRYWIYKALVEQQELNKTRVHRELIDGEGYLFLGKSYKLKIENNLPKPVTLNGDYFLIDEGVVHNAKNHFINFYRENGKDILSQRVNYFKDKLGVSPDGIRVMELKNRWASKSPNNSLNFHWKTVMAPLTIVDYVIVHELAHFIKPTHNTEFWGLVSSVIPDYIERREWLKVNGAGLDI